MIAEPAAVDRLNGLTQSRYTSVYLPVRRSKYVVRTFRDQVRGNSTQKVIPRSGLARAESNPP